MDLGLTDRVVWVAGSSRGIGLAIARAFLAEGSRVAISGRAAEPLTAAEAALTVEFGADHVMSCRGDFLRADSIAAACEAVRRRWTRIDCLVSAVGSGTARGGWAVSDEDWEAALAHNLSASRRLADAVLPDMVRAGKGNIVFITSIVGLESVNAPLTYSAAKAALTSYGKNLAREVGPSGVRVNCVAPGNILFQGGSWERKLEEQPERFREYIQKEVPLQRFGTPEEIASVVTFLASDRASFLTGACVVVDGGQTRRY